MLCCYTLWYHILQCHILQCYVVVVGRADFNCNNLFQLRQMFVKYFLAVSRQNMDKCMDHTLTALVYHDNLRTTCSLHYFWG